MLRTKIVSENHKSVFFAISLLFLFSLFCVQSVRAGELHFVLNGKSIHLKEKPGLDLNEHNLGVGFQYEFNNVYKNWVPFLNAGGFSDSFEEPSYYVGGGIVRRYKFRNQLVNFHMDAGLTAFMMTKSDINDNEPFPGMLPMVSFGNKYAALNVTYIPKVSDHRNATELWFMQLKVRLGRL